MCALELEFSLRFKCPHSIYEVMKRKRISNVEIKIRRLPKNRGISFKLRANKKSKLRAALNSLLYPLMALTDVDFLCDPRIIEEKDVESRLEEIIRAMRYGKLVIFPTETAYGIATSMLSEKGIKNIYRVKKRPETKPISCIMRKEHIREYVHCNDLCWELVEKFMPGPLTLVVRKKENLYSNSDKVAFRVSSSPVANLLCREFPISATSANISGKPTNYDFLSVYRDFKDAKEVAFFINGGNLKKIPPSTIYDVEKRKVLREGPVKL